ncbi:MAG: heparan-alpha-glucosaminide N-acetyltransferase domain-containing protein, partial [Clostridia bacterium]
MTESNTLLTENTKISLLPKPKKQRIWEIDFLRGFCVVLMIFDHLALLLGVFFGPNWFGYDMLGDAFGPKLCRLCAYYILDSQLRLIGHPIVLFIFFAISGISCSFSRSNTKRGLQLAFIALLYTLGSYIAEELLGIYGTLTTFGVLNFYSVCILFYAFLCFISKNNKIFKMVASAVIVIGVLLIYHLFTPPETTPKIFAIFFPPYDIHGNPSLFYSQASFSPGDLFTIVPYAAFFFFGTFIAPIIYGNKRTHFAFLDHAWHKPMCFVGKHALWFYVGHV